MEKRSYGRIALLQLSLEDCGLANRNVYVKEYEKECLYSLYPDYGKTVQTVAVGSCLSHEFSTVAST